MKYKTDTKRMENEDDDELEMEQLVPEEQRRYLRRNGVRREPTTIDINDRTYGK